MIPSSQPHRRSWMDRTTTWRAHYPHEAVAAHTSSVMKNSEAASRLKPGFWLIASYFGPCQGRYSDGTEILHRSA